MTNGYKMGLITLLALALAAPAQAGAAMTAMVKPPAAVSAPAATLVQSNARSMMTPPQGSELRRTLMDTMRPPFEDALNGPVEFFVRRLVVMGDWAFASVRPQRPGGRPINWSQTQFAREVRGGSFNTEESAALMRFHNGRWMLVEHVIGPTDVYWIEWEQKFNLPERFFTDP